MKFLFYADWTPAIPYLEPLYNYFERQGHECIFYIDAMNPSNAAVQKVLVKQGYKFTPTRNLSVDWAFCADPRSACPHERRINVFHGAASKSQDFSRVHRTGARGIHFVPSQWYADLFHERQGIPLDEIRIGGLSKWDPFDAPNPLRAENPKVLYLPTHGPYSSVHLLGDSIKEIEHDEHRHHSILDTQITMTDELDCCFGTDRSRSMDNLLWDADIVIADMGSTVVEAVALGKMVIQIRSQAVIDYHHNKGATEQEILDLPEVYWPMKYGFGASDVEGIKKLIAAYPEFLDKDQFPFPTETIIDNIGNFQVSKVIEQYVLGNR